MPFDREVHFGYVGVDKVFTFAKRMGINLTTYSGDLVTKEEFLNTGSELEIGLAANAKLAPRLRNSYIDAVTAMGWTVVDIDNGRSKSDFNKERYIGLSTRWGLREAVVWSLSVYYDPHEVGDSKNETTIGVNLSGRYFPIILDMENNGSLGSVITLNQEFMNCINICKEILIKEFPEMYDADIYIKEQFY